MKCPSIRPYIQGSAIFSQILTKLLERILNYTEDPANIGF